MQAGCQDATTEGWGGGGAHTNQKAIKETEQKFEVLLPLAVDFMELQGIIKHWKEPYSTFENK